MIRASSFVVFLAVAAANECAVEYAKQGPCDIDAHELGLPCAWRDGKCKDLKWQHATSRAPIRCGIRAGNMKFIALHWRTQRRNASSPCGAAGGECVVRLGRLPPAAVPAKGLDDDASMAAVATAMAALPADASRDARARALLAALEAARDRGFPAATKDALKLLKLRHRVLRVRGSPRDGFAPRPPNSLRLCPDFAPHHRDSHHRAVAQVSGSARSTSSPRRRGRGSRAKPSSRSSRGRSTAT